MTAKPPPPAATPRFVVRQLGPRCFVVDDTATCLSYDMRFTRKFAQADADRRNRRADPDWDETPAEAARFDRWWGDRDINRDED